MDAWYEGDGLVPHHVQTRFEAIASNKRMMNAMFMKVEAKFSCTP